MGFTEAPAGFKTEGLHFCTAPLTGGFPVPVRTGAELGTTAAGSEACGEVLRLL